MESAKYKKVPPDGGWAWMIVFAFVIVGLLGTHSFGLLYKYKLEELKLDATDIAILQNVNVAFGAILAIFGGVLIRRYGLRKIAVLSQCLITAGMLWSAFVQSFTEFIFSYGIIQSTGATFGMMTGNISIQTYFQVHRNKANGIATAISAIGLVISPIYITSLQRTYDSDGAMLILAALAMNGFISSILLQPVKWHMKLIPLDNESLLLEHAHQIEINSNKVHDNQQLKNTFKESASKIKSISKWFVENFDLTLLQDKIVLNTIIGINLADFAELNYFMIMPFILDDLLYTNIEVATLMSINGIADICFRLLAPFIGDYFDQKTRPMFVYSLGIFVVARLAISYSSNYTETMLALILLGIGKGIFTVYWNVLLPSCVSIERLPSAHGILMILNGMIMLAAGPIVGVLRDYTGSYRASIFLLNVSTIMAMIIWISEIVKTHLENKKRINENL